MATNAMRIGVVRAATALSLRRVGAAAAAARSRPSACTCQAQRRRQPAPTPTLLPASRCFSSRAGRRQAPELYRLLGVQPSASAREIKQGFLVQARLHHPDVSTNPDAADTFDKLQGALTTLSDPETRRDYDSSAGCVQPDYVYAGQRPSSSDWIPLAAMAEQELEKHAEHLDERIRTVADSVAALGDGAVVYKAREEELSEELRGLTVRRTAVREELQKIAAARIRHGGGARARRKRPVFHAEYEYAERYSDVYKYSDDPQLEDEAALEQMLNEVLGMSPNAAGNVP